MLEDFPIKKAMILSLQILALMVGLFIFNKLRKRTFIPRLAIVGPSGSGKTRLFYALRDHRICKTTHSCVTNIFTGYLPLTQGKCEIIDFNSDPSKWPENSKFLFMNSMVILLVFNKESMHSAVSLL